ncbi:MAG: hypothetical protein ACOCXG_02760 [Nanoarchaeota archaeon]
MDLKYLLEFLEKFEIRDEVIGDFVKGKKVLERNKNVFIVPEEFDENQIYGDKMIFIKLKDKTLPSRYLINMIAVNGKVLEILSESKALDFTYGKDLDLNNVKNLELVEGKYYPVVFEDEVLGYAEYSRNKLRNKFNIGEYLKE